jgi:chorismate lyase/3-hydroxybenzoate synthase
VPAPFDLSPPQWVSRLLEANKPVEHSVNGNAACSVRVIDSAAFTLVTVRVAGARSLDDRPFEQRAADAYRTVQGAIRARPGRHVVRFWNYIPDIRRRNDGGLDRYMIFNAGRFAACGQWFGDPGAFDRLLPAASAVGHDGDDLVVHSLAGAEAGNSIDNPRQVPSYRYSRRFGPRPPCFARATVLPGATPGGRLVLVAGTASIRGEETMHPGDVRAQTLETFENLSVIVRTASGQSGPDRPFGSLRCLRDLRVYFVRPADLSVIRRMVGAAMPQVEHVEYVRADLCRPELLVEIEGTARQGTHG